MFNLTEQQWLESTYSAVGEGKVLFNRNVKPEIKTCTLKRGHGRH